MDKVINLGLMKSPTNWVYVYCVVLAASIIAHQCLVMFAPNALPVPAPAGSPAPDGGVTSRTQK